MKESALPPIRPCADINRATGANPTQASCDVAIVGMACRLSGATDYETHWQDMLGGYELLTRLSAADLKLAGVAETLVLQESFRPVTSLVDYPGALDADFFGISPSEAAAMDPQHRIFLELCWSAMEDSGITPETLERRIGVFAGGGRHAYLRYVEKSFADEDWLDGSIHGLQSDIGNYGDFLATRVSYRLGLTGPSMNVQTACSTGLMAVHLACRSISAGECEAALAGAVNIHTPQISGYHFEEGSICSDSGHLRPFDEKADGSVFGNGGGVVLLKSLPSALRDGDRVIAVIRATACNNAGDDKISFTAPSVWGQAAVITEALRGAGFDPASIGYVEAHGTGTPLGDPIEVEALNQAFGIPGGSRTCALGTAKSQIGHLGPAAGIIGLIRAALVVDHGVIPKCVNFDKPSSRIAWGEGPFYVPTENVPWNGHRRAGVSAFGVGGTNVHALLEQAPRSVGRPTTVADRAVPIVLSARSGPQLREQRHRLADYLDRHPSVPIEDVSRTLSKGRRPERIRASWAVTSVAELPARLREELEEGAEPESASLPVVMAFPGQGDQYAGAARSLYPLDRVFSDAVDECSRILKNITDFDIREVMFPQPSDLALASSRIHRSQRAQEALFVFEYSLGRTLMEAGLVPSIMIGHSAGEYAAAALSGVLSLPDAILLAAERGRLMEHVAPAGAMMAVGLTADELAEIIPHDLDLAAVNAPGQCVVSGSVEAIAAFEEQMNASGALNRVLGTAVAAHSRLMDRIQDNFAKVAGTVEFGQGAIPMASTLLGGIEDSAAFASPDYWTAHLRRPVRFMDAAEAVLARGRAVVVEVGPGRAMCGMFRQLDEGINLPGLSLWRKGYPEPGSIAEVVGKAWELGAEINWSQTLSKLSARSISLPGRQWQRKVLWTNADEASGELPRLVEQSWMWAPRWVLTPGSADARQPDRVVVITAEPGADWIEDVDATITLVEAADAHDSALVQERLAAVEDDVRSADAFVFVGQPVSGDDAVQVALSQNFWPLLRFASAIAVMRVGRTTPLLVVVPQEHNPSDPATELLTGPCRVLPQEYPGVEVSMVRAERASAALLDEELASLTPDTEIAYIHGRRCRRLYERVEAPLGPEPWRNGCTYLVTGGTGGIGLALADSAAAVEGVRMVLTHRPRPAGGSHDGTALTKRLDQLRERGLAIDVVDADVRDAVAMRDVRQRYGPFDGVVHAAGVASGRLIATMDSDSVAEVLSPKIDGVKLLDEFVIDGSTRWVVLCSSMSATVGGIGHADYSSANAYLDAYAEKITVDGRHAVSIEYDAWVESGMAVNESRKTLHDAAAGSSLTEATEGRRIWRTRIAGDDWVLQEHRVDGHRILPGTAIIELVHRAAMDLMDIKAVEMQAFDLLRPTRCAENATLIIEVEFVARNTGWSVTMRTGAEDATLTDTATCTLIQAGPVVGVSPPPDLRPVTDGMPTPSDESRLVRLGGRWDCVRGWRERSDGHIEARCVLPTQYASDLGNYQLHPALLDNALGASLSRLDGQYLPMSYERIVIRGSLGNELFSRINMTESSQDTVSLDVHCWTPDGELVMSVEKYQLRRIELGQLFGTTPRSADSSTLRQRISGDLASLRFVPAPRPACGPHEVVVQVRAAGLNFKEVLMAGGLLDQPHDYRFGLECAGVVVQVGAQVESLRVGEAVFGLGAACFDQYAVLEARLARAIPRGLSFEEAAAVPVAFTTAYDCLVGLARARKGESVLIHAVTGGVGGAAFQIADDLGLTVIGTAGSPQKRDYAREMGVAEVFDSRSLDFEQAVTERGGVDIVLNSLGGAYIEAGLRCLRTGGRFVEMGRRDILSGRPLAMALFSQGTTFAAYYPDVHSSRYEATLDQVVHLLRKSVVRPLPYRTFPEKSVADAFLHMARGAHVGKVLLTREGSRERAWSNGGYSVEGRGIANDLGVSAFKRAIRLSEARVLVTLREVNHARDEVIVASHVLQDSDLSQERAVNLDLLDLVGDTERRLGEIWASILRLDAVSRNDTFVNLGGDSLYATQVVSCICEEFGVRIPPASILGTITLAELGRLLESDASQAAG